MIKGMIVGIILTIAFICCVILHVVLIKEDKKRDVYFKGSFIADDEYVYINFPALNDTMMQYMKLPSELFDKEFLKKVDGEVDIDIYLN